MKVEALDHVNIITDDLDGTARFYAELLGLERRDGPPPLTPLTAQWMYDDAGRAIIQWLAVDARWRWVSGRGYSREYSYLNRARGWV